MRTKLSTLSDSNEDKILTILSYTIFGLHLFFFVEFSL